MWFLSFHTWECIIYKLFWDWVSTTGDRVKLATSDIIGTLLTTLLGLGLSFVTLLYHFLFWACVHQRMCQVVNFIKKSNWLWHSWWHGSPRSARCCITVTMVITVRSGQWRGWALICVLHVYLTIPLGFTAQTWSHCHSTER